MLSEMTELVYLVYKYVHKNSMNRKLRALSIESEKFRQNKFPAHRNDCREALFF